MTPRQRLVAQWHLKAACAQYLMAKEAASEGAHSCESLRWQLLAVHTCMHRKAGRTCAGLRSCRCHS